ncbi:MAG: aldo/keto reductase [Gammaproteobacteria bacterium]
MQYVNLGASGLQISRLGLGAMGFGDPAWRSWVLREDSAQRIFDRAIEHGINFFDTCNYYSGGESERLLGRLIRNARVARESIVVATKFGMPMGDHANARGYSRKNIFAAVDESLRRLDMEYIDLYQTHIWDRDTNIEEMMSALADLVSAGKVLYIGATDMPTWQFVKANSMAEARNTPQFVSMQNHYNLVWREDESELLPYCHADGIGWIPYSPMARGALCGSERRTIGASERLRTDEYIDIWYSRDADRTVGSRVDQVAGKHRVQPGQVALGWVLGRHPQVAPIFGADEVSQIDAAVAALDLQLDEDDEKMLTQNYQPRLRN